MSNTNIVTITSRERRARIDSIHDSVSVYAKSVIANDFTKADTAYTVVASNVKALFVDVYNVDPAAVNHVVNAILMGTARYSKKEGCFKVSGAAFRSFIVHALLEGVYGVDVSAHNAGAVKKSKKAIKEEEVYNYFLSCGLSADEAKEAASLNK